MTKVRECIDCHNVFVVERKAQKRCDPCTVLRNQKTCPKCGERFTAAPYQRICDKCEAKKLLRVCPKCGKEFIKRPYQRVCDDCHPPVAELPVSNIGICLNCSKPFARETPDQVYCKECEERQ